MAIVAAVDDSFKRPGSVPFSWEVRPASQETLSSPFKTTVSLPATSPAGAISSVVFFHLLSLQEPLSIPSRSFISYTLEAQTAAAVAVWTLLSGAFFPFNPARFLSSGGSSTVLTGLRKSKTGGRRKTGSRSDREYCSDMETMSPWTASSRRSVSPRWDSPKSSSLPSGSRRDSPAKLNGSPSFPEKSSPIKPKPLGYASSDDKSPPLS
ncbi:hypothetical protein HID58_095272 [Brassica napus]|uniref:Uncharacterized protein n=1 Tax=Brassica napus TaxID=3708 RepID=A0ABQ7X6H8_BRANA|nr:hypothetical protein HID58_095272 [Brassica napus]